MKRVGKLAVLSIILLAAACEQAPEEEENEPTAEDIDAVSAGTIDCTRSPATGYRSGTPSSIEVVTVDGKPVEVATADAFWVMREAASSAGVEIFVVSGFRTNEQQRYFYNCFVNCNCNNCNRAARPGYSNHQSGTALDLNASASGVGTWLSRNASRYGFTRTVPDEAWHYELTGHAAGQGPCSGRQLTFTSPTAGANLENGGSLKTRAMIPVHHVRYLSGSTLLGTSENPDDQFEVRPWFSTLGAKGIDAIAYDAEDKELARTHIEVVAVASTAPSHEPLSLEDLGDRSSYRNGYPLRAATGGSVVRVAYFAGREALGESIDTSDAFGVHQVFGAIGWRAVLAIGYDASGRERTRATVLVRVLPGEESAAGASVVFIPRSGAHLANGGAILAVGSASVESMRYFEDGDELGVVGGDRGKFAFIHTFASTGQHRLRAEGVDSDGNVVASEEIDATIDP